MSLPEFPSAVSPTQSPGTGFLPKRIVPSPLSRQILRPNMQEVKLGMIGSAVEPLAAAYFMRYSSTAN
jgi:hypothetical protein